MFYQDVYDIVR